MYWDTGNNAPTSKDPEVSSGPTTSSFEKQCEIFVLLGNREIVLAGLLQNFGQNSS